MKRIWFLLIAANCSSSFGFHAVIRALPPALACVWLVCFYPRLFIITGNDTCKYVEFTVVQCLCHTRDVCLNVLISFSLRRNRVLHKDEFSFLNLKDISLQNIKSLLGLFCWTLIEHSDLLICWVFFTHLTRETMQGVSVIWTKVSCWCQIMARPLQADGRETLTQGTIC